MNYYEKLNDYLSEQAPKQRLMLYLAAAIFIIVGGYYLFGMDLEEEAEIYTSKAIRVQNEIRKLSPQAAKSKLKQITRELENKKADISSQEIKIKQIRHDFAGDTAIEPTGEPWASFLEDILERSNNLSLELQEIATEPILIEKKTGLLTMKILQLKGIGKYQSIEKLIRYIETRSFLVKIKYAKITQETNKTPEFEISFSILGVKI